MSQVLNDYTGNLVVTQDGVSTSGEKAPASVYLVNNSATKGRRISRINEYGYSIGNSAVLGQSIGFNYSEYNETKITTSGVDNSYGTSDDIVTEYQFDNYGRLVSTNSVTNWKRLGATETSSGGRLRYRQMFTNTDVVPGKTYTLSAYIKTTGFSTLTSGKYGAGLVVYCYYEDGTSINMLLLQD